MGWALKYIFGLTMSLPVLAVFVLMVAMAAHIVLKRVKEPGLSLGLPVFWSMLGSYALVTVMVTGVVINADPWWQPRYFLPLGGMIVGNSMNALAISLERLFSLLRGRRDEVEMRLCLGADATEAARPLVREAVKAGMIPSVNAMMGVGVVFHSGHDDRPDPGRGRPHAGRALPDRGHAHAHGLGGPVGGAGGASGPAALLQRGPAAALAAGHGRGGLIQAAAHPSGPETARQIISLKAINRPNCLRLQSGCGLVHRGLELVARGP